MTDPPGSAGEDRARPVLERRLGLRDAVLLGLGAMLGAGIFAAPAPAAAAAGNLLLVAVCAAGLVAWCNATASARLAAVHPQAGGTYVYASRRLGPTWGHLAGWGFVAGKTASCAAMALTVGAYAWPAQPRVAGLLAVGVAVALGTGGVQRGARLTRVLVTVAVAVLALVVVAGLAAPGPAGTPPPGAAAADPPPGSAYGVLQAAGLLFFAFAGYARLATLGEEVREPRRTIPRAIALALLAALVLYVLVLAAALHALGAPRLAASTSPLADVVAAAGWQRAVPLVRLAAVAASLGALLALLLGVSRTAFAMARDGHLPVLLAGVRRGVPHRAELAVAAAVAVLVLTTDLRGAVGFSSFAVLVYYLLAQLSARRLQPEEGRPPGWLTLVGAAGCAVLAVTLPRPAVVTGASVLALGLLAGRVTRSRRPAP